MILNISDIVESFNVLQNDMRRICDQFENIEERLSNIELTLYPITKVTTFSDWDDIENSILNEYIPNENQEVIISDANVCGLIIEGELVSSLYTLSDGSSEIETTNKTQDSTKLYIGFNSFNTPKNWMLLNERGEKVLTLKFSPAIFKAQINHIWFYDSDSEELGDFVISEENEGILTISSSGRNYVESIRGIKLSGNNLTTDIHITSNNTENQGVTEIIDGDIFISCEGIDTTPIILSTAQVGPLVSSDEVLLTININE